MNCPNCETHMVCEQVPLVYQVSSYDDKKDIPHNGKTFPSAHYYCEECDSEWVWSMGTPGLLFLDGGSAVSDKFFHRFST